MSAATQEFGRAGEAAAAAWYEQRGYEVLARNWRTRRGELDLVLSRASELVIAEVKSRRTDRAGSGFDAVDHRKQHRIRSLAAEFVSSTDTWFEQIRFDVVAVTPVAGQLCVEVLEAAF